MDIASMEKDVNICTLSKLTTRTEKRREVIVNSHILQKVQISINLEQKIQMRKNQSTY